MLICVDIVPGILWSYDPHLNKTMIQELNESLDMLKVDEFQRRGGPVCSY